MKAVVKLFILLAISILATGKDILFDINGENATTAHYQCVRQQYQQISMWLYWDEYWDHQSSLQNFKNAKNAGLNIHMGVTPCRSRSPESQISRFQQLFGKDAFERFWIQPGFTFSKGCDWSKYSAEDNCNYMKNILQLLKIQQTKTGVIAMRQLWAKVLGSPTACPQLSEQLMVWVPMGDQQDGQPNFDNYTPIGGWKEPYMKLYSAIEVCGRQYYLLYLE